ncbi:MAG: hypothetical protein Hens2KO_12650 [Henriciella sp.]
MDVTKREIGRTVQSNQANELKRRAFETVSMQTIGRPAESDRPIIQAHRV